MNMMKSLSRFLVATICLILFIGCGKEPEPVPEEPYLTTDVTSLEFPDTGGTLEINVKSNGQWTASLDNNNFYLQGADGHFYETISSTGNGKIKVYSSDNASSSSRTGTLTVKSNSGLTAKVSLSISVNQTLVRIQGILDEVYKQLDGAHWKDPWVKGEKYPGFSWNPETGKAIIVLNEFGAKGEISDRIGDLGDVLEEFHIYDAKTNPGITGTLPDSFRKLVNLKRLSIQGTEMTSLPDVFGNMTRLEYVRFAINEQMAGPMPESLGRLPSVTAIEMVSNAFTGEIPSSWAGKCDLLDLRFNCLTGDLSQFLAGCADIGKIKAFLKKDNLSQKDGYGFDISNVDIPGFYCWPNGDVEDLDGNTFTFDEVVRQNRYTVYINWAPWCPFSAQLMPKLRDYYEQYRQDGLEILATVMAHEEGELWKEQNDIREQKAVINEKGYGNWYNFAYWFTDNGSTETSYTMLMNTPAAEVYDAEGNIIYSTFKKYPDPVRDRFNKDAAVDLIPFLETLMGPSVAPDPYTSTDFSRDGEVLRLQTASVGNGINIVFMGDAYTDKDMNPGGLYETVMSQAMEELFAIEPYKSFRDRFNVYAVKVVSPNGRIGEGYTTALSSAFGNGTRVTGNTEKCYEYALMVPEITDASNMLVSVLVNTSRSVGTTYMSESLQSSVAFSSSERNDPSLFGPTLRHEAGGHGFGFLADEYHTYLGTPPQSHINEYDNAYGNYGWYSNVDFTNSRSDVHWSAFLSDDRYKNEVGVFEGAALYKQGAYRPSENSMMRYNAEYFNAPSRQAIYKRIMELSGEGYTFEKFLEYDAVNRGKQVQSARPPLKAASNPKWIPAAPPVIVR